MATEYSKKTNAELVEILKSRSLPHTGKKADMVARLQEADKAGADTAKPAAPAKPGTVEDVIDWDDDTTEAPAAAATASTANPAVEAPPIEQQVPNPTAVPNQKVDIDPSTTHDLKVGAPEDSAPKAESAQPANGAGEKAAEPEKPPVDYSIGLANTDLEAELAKRKARAEKFGIVEDENTALQEAQKAMERAKRFGTTDDSSKISMSRLDQALPSEQRRKRGRGDDGDGGRGGKRRDFRGRRGRMGRRNRGPRNSGQGESTAAAASSTFSEADRIAMEKRKARFG